MSKAINILLAEDEIVLGKLIREALERKSYQVIWAKDGQEAYERYMELTPDLCVLDVMMAAMDGFELAARIRTHSPRIPLMFLTARSDIKDVIRGFESGGNDYLKKPFSLDELLLRVKELLRRSELSSGNQQETTYRLGIYEFNTTTQLLRSGKGEVRLSFKESELLKNLLLYKNALMPRKEALLKLWSDDNFFNSRTMDVYIGRLRKYLKHDPSVYIINVRGYGYKLIEQDENPRSDA